ncbi:MAG: hypothetical protein STSR0003_23380 [Smithella sp.]
MDLAFSREITMNFIEKITGNLFVKRRLIWLLGLLLVLGTAPAMAAANNEKSLIPEKKFN